MSYLGEYLAGRTPAQPLQTSTCNRGASPTGWGADRGADRHYQRQHGDVIVVAQGWGEREGRMPGIPEGVPGTSFTDSCALD